MCTLLQYYFALLFAFLMQYIHNSVIHDPLTIVIMIGPKLNYTLGTTQTVLKSKGCIFSHITTMVQ